MDPGLTADLVYGIPSCLADSITTGCTRSRSQPTIANSCAVVVPSPRSSYIRRLGRYSWGARRPPKPLAQIQRRRPSHHQIDLVELHPSPKSLLCNRLHQRDRPQEPNRDGKESDPRAHGINAQPNHRLPGSDSCSSVQRRPGVGGGLLGEHGSVDHVEEPALRMRSASIPPAPLFLRRSSSSRADGESRARIDPPDDSRPPRRRLRRAPGNDGRLEPANDITGISSERSRR
jgi:hypothetical protein